MGWGLFLRGTSEFVLLVTSLMTWGKSWDLMLVLRVKRRQNEQMCGSAQSEETGLQSLADIQG